MTIVEECEGYLLALEKLCGYAQSGTGQHYVEVKFCSQPHHAWCDGSGNRNKASGVDSRHKYRLPTDWFANVYSAGWGYLNGMICLEAVPLPRHNCGDAEVVKTVVAAQAGGFKIYPVECYCVKYAELWGFGASMKRAYQAVLNTYEQALREGNDGNEQATGPFVRRDWRAEAKGTPTARNRGLR